MDQILDFMKKMRPCLKHREVPKWNSSESVVRPERAEEGHKIGKFGTSAHTR